MYMKLNSHPLQMFGRARQEENNKWRYENQPGYGRKFIKKKKCTAFHIDGWFYKWCESMSLIVILSFSLRP